jgi:hypothetical protein
MNLRTWKSARRFDNRHSSPASACPSVAVIAAFGILADRFLESSPTHSAMPSSSLARVALVCGAAALTSTPAALSGEPADWPVLISEDFESGAVSGWAATDPSAWKLDADGDNHVFSQFAQSRVQTPVRSPFNRAVLSGLPVGSFQLDVDLRSTARDYPHRSLCLFFGYQDPLHFYYVHFGQQTDDHANQIFIVNEAPRTKISTRTTDGTPWDNEWHHARITRDVESGEIAVYFDDMEQPVMTATDTTFRWGTVGIGSFDDTGVFDNVVLRGVGVRPEAQSR